MVLEMKKPVGSGVAEGRLNGGFSLEPRGSGGDGQLGKGVRRQRFSLGLWHQPQRIKW